MKKHKILHLAIVLLTALFASGCPARTAQIVATRTVVAFGSVTEQLAQQNDSTYTEATDALRVRLVSEHGTIQQYVAAVGPLDAAHTRRARALARFADTLYDAARLIDRSREAGQSATSYVGAAVSILAKLDETLSLLEGHELPALPIPQVVRDLRRSLQTIAGVPTS